MASISKNQIKLIRSLEQKKYRDKESLFVAEGEKTVAEAIASGFDVVDIFRIEETGEEVMSRITMLSSPSPVLAVIRKPSYNASEKIEELVSGKPFVLALDSLRDPGNVGTIIRLADWFGIEWILASPDTVDIYNPKVVQATMGAIFRCGFIYCDLKESLNRFRTAGLPVYGTYLEGENIYTAAVECRGAVIMGSESNGISPELESVVSKKLHIPTYPAGARTSESLNVATAAAITCSEFRRRAF